MDHLSLEGIEIRIRTRGADGHYTEEWVPLEIVRKLIMGDLERGLYGAMVASGSPPPHPRAVTRQNDPDSLSGE